MAVEGPPLSGMQHWILTQPCLQGIMRVSYETEIGFWSTKAHLTSDGLPHVVGDCVGKVNASRQRTRNLKIHTDELRFHREE